MATSPIETCTSVETSFNSSEKTQAFRLTSFVSTWREPRRVYDSFNRLPKRDHAYVTANGKCLFDNKYIYYSQRVDNAVVIKSPRRKKVQKKAEKRPKKQAQKQTTPKTVNLQDKALAQNPGVLAVEKSEHQMQPAEETPRGSIGEWSCVVWGCIVTYSVTSDPDRTIIDRVIEEPQFGSITSFEDGFHTRPSIRLPVPDHIKGILVDDWENVTKNNQLVPLPHAHPVDQIINDYLEYERPSRDPESPHVDILEETMAGLKEYFEKSLSRILLYRFERPQYHEFRKEWEKATENGPKSVCDTYGAEHLCRLIVSLPELIAQTTMDQQSVSRLREEISKFTAWLGKNTTKYFVSEYETPAQEYVDRARNI
ncbi:hypothetical protein ACHAQH_001123 [Verticillium albo-atrum]